MLVTAIFIMNIVIKSESNYISDISIRYPILGIHSLLFKDKLFTRR